MNPVFDIEFPFPEEYLADQATNFGHDWPEFCYEKHEFTSIIFVYYPGKTAEDSQLGKKVLPKIVPRPC